ncbi:hypothetical protein MKW92_030962 [Papaver armeniacum]|nr:hypothetical protein MKW92_030962 [Papaver armeniacum]
MFSPALIVQSNFLDLAFGAALAVFLILEIVRLSILKRFNFFGKPFHNHNLCRQTIATLSSLLSVSYRNHFSLLLGCALPKWLSTDFNDRPLAPFAGILSLGSINGWIQVWGSQVEQNRHNKDILLFFLSEKSIEGTAAGITSVLLPLLASTGFIISQHWISLLIVVTASGLLEAYIAQLDNAFIPLVFYILFCL